MGTLAEIRTGLQTRLATVSSINAYDRWPDTVNIPAAIVMPRGFRYTAMGGAATSGEYDFDIVVLIQLGTLSAAQQTLDSYLALSGDNSLAVALLGDRDLGDKADDLAIRNWRDYGPVESGGTVYLSATIEIVVLV